ncbi:MAG: lipoyl protein ligase domain-containing protein, partial [Thermoplasmata archaeon]
MGEAPPPERMDGVGHLARDAELLKLGTAAARVGISTDLHLSLGVSQPEEARCARQARRLGISVIRRTTGGAAVLVRPGDLLWTRVLALDDPEVGRDFVRAYGR